MSGPLDGIVVADFSRIVAGPYCTMLLGDLGADVIKVEGPHGEDTRAFMPPARDGVSTYYLSINRNKRSIALDLADPADLAVAHELSARADVFVHNFKPGGIERFALGYSDVAARNPGSIYCAISGFGTRAGAALPGYDLVVQAASGLMHLTGDPAGPPQRAGIAAFDVMTGLHAAIGILAALNERERSGRGQLVETNLLSAALSSMINQTSAYVAGGVVPQPMGNGHLSLFPYDPMATGDGDLVVIAGNNAQFRVLCAELGVPGLADDPRFATVSARNAHREELRPLLLAELKRKSAAEWFAQLTKAGLPCGPINDVRGGVEFAEELGLEPVAMAGGVPTVRNPLAFSRTPVRYDYAPPPVDGSGAEIREWLRARAGEADHA
ncbi:CaiB/BaiF CoA-transferase family protein [Amycolatopsis sp. GM8]|uniref:CaiB/BaiF CoA transferase family protein n=1 Tax=Amycolatopsis sp. GM8 TaxID=2896530 RepID=UPI001F34EE9F|nr:CoA transferase [Amycolatopsis sp. GM8]